MLLSSSERFAIAIVLSTALGSSAHAADPAWNAEDGWKRLSVREKIGQTVILSSDIEAETRVGGGSLKAFFEKYPAGGVFLGSWKFGHVDPSARSATIRQLVEDYRAASRLPLFIQEDYEQGPGSSLADYTNLPMLMALGATNSPSLASEYGRTLALETRSLGINWLLNPVVDLNRNFLSPVVNTRSLSDDPDRVIRLARSQIETMQGHGLISTIKHFPGDGVDFRDQHLLTTVNSLSVPEWRQTYGHVFQQLIEAGAASVMVGHISLPAYQKQRLSGRVAARNPLQGDHHGPAQGRAGFQGRGDQRRAQHGRHAGLLPDAPLDPDPGLRGRHRSHALARARLLRCVGRAHPERCDPHAAPGRRREPRVGPQASLRLARGRVRRNRALFRGAAPCVLGNGQEGGRGVPHPAAAGPRPAAPEESQDASAPRGGGGAREPGGATPEDLRTHRGSAERGRFRGRPAREPVLLRQWHEPERRLRPHPVRLRPPHSRTHWHSAALRRGSAHGRPRPTACPGTR